MPGVSTVTYSLCFHTLSQCAEFQSNEGVRALFVTEELVPFKANLLDATALGDRVSNALAYLIDKPTSHGRPALTAFLELLCIKHPEPDPLHGNLKACLRSLSHQDTHKGIPYVVVAMVSSEAQTLAKGQDCMEGFETLLEHLPPNWETHYHDKREVWQIHSESASTIGEVIEDMFTKVGVGPGNPYSEKCFPLDGHSQEAADAQLELEKIGGILVIDAISLFYRP